VENNGGKYSGFFSKKLRAGKRRTYFFDVRSTKQGDYFITITESKKKFDSEGYESHKIFLYKEDFKKFVEALNETLNHVKTELMPDYDYDAERLPRTDKEEGNESDHSDHRSDHRSDHTAPKIDPTTGEPNIDHKSSSGIGDDEEIKWG
jgi:hypothetical protein